MERSVIAANLKATDKYSVEQVEKNFDMDVAMRKAMVDEYPQVSVSVVVWSNSGPIQNKVIRCMLNHDHCYQSYLISVSTHNHTNSEFYFRSP